MYTSQPHIINQIWGSSGPRQQCNEDEVFYMEDDSMYIDTHPHYNEENPYMKSNISMQEDLAGPYSSSYDSATDYSRSYDSETIRYVSPKDLHSVWPFPVEHSLPSSRSFGSYPDFGEAIPSTSADDIIEDIGESPSAPSFMRGIPISSAYTNHSQFEMEMEPVEEVESDLEEESEVSKRMDDDGEDSESDVCIAACDLPVVKNFVLPPSKTPCLDALAFCVVNRLGAEQTEEDKEANTISIYDCDKLLAYIKHFCPKQNQTNNSEARIKALKRWFSNIPAKKKRSERFQMEMKPDKKVAIRRIIRKMEQFVHKGEECSPPKDQ